MNISINDLLFMSNDDVVFTEGVDEYLEKFRDQESIDPIGILHQQDGKYYARGGRHRTYMFYHRLGKREIEVEILENFPLHEPDRYHLEHGCVAINDLTEEHLPRPE